MTRPSLRKTEDILPKVLVAGKPSDCVPRIIICDGMQRKTKRSHTGNASMQFRIPNPPPCPGVCTKPPPACSPPPPPPPCPPPPPPSCPPPMPSCSPPPSCPPPPSCLPPPPSCLPPPTTCCPPPPSCPPPIKPPSSRRRHSECCPPPPPPRQPSNFDESTACSKLMLRMQSLKEEMCAMSRQNERMQQQIRNGHAVQPCRPNQNAPCARPATYPKDVEGRFREYSKHTGLLERQVETMEQSVRRLNQQFLEAEKKQREMEQARIHAQKMTETLMCQQLERQPKLKCRDYCKGKCAKQTEKCSCSSPDYKCG